MLKIISPDAQTKLIKVEIAIRHTNTEIIICDSNSEDIDSINKSVVDNIRFEIVKRQILKPHPRTVTVSTIENLLGQPIAGKALFSSDLQLTC